MEFLGIGYQELLLVLVLLLVVVGPERLPSMAYQMGRAVRTLQQYARAVRDEFSDEIGYVEDQYKTLRGEVDATRVIMRDEQAKLNAELRDATEPIRLAVQDDPLANMPPAPSSPTFAPVEGDPAMGETAAKAEAAKAPPLLF